MIPTDLVYIKECWKILILFIFIDAILSKSNYRQSEHVVVVARKQFLLGEFFKSYLARSNLPQEVIKTVLTPHLWLNRISLKKRSRFLN
jgi:hypothetical protein